MSGPKKSEPCRSFFLGKTRQDVEFSERRRRRGSKQEVCDRRGELLSAQLKKAFFKKEKVFFILKINSTTGFDLNERRQKSEPCRSAFAVTLPRMARLANEAAVKGVDRRSRTETANPVGSFIILNKLAFSDSIIKHF